MQIKELHKKQANRLSQEKFDELVKKARKEHDKPVRGMFEFLDAQGGWLEFSYRFFKGDPIITMKLVHGEICDLPMGIVKHLNNTKKKIRTLGKEINPNARGVPMTFEVQSRVRFTPVEVL